MITGPAGSGKTTIGNALAKEIPNTAHIDADYVKHFIQNGFLYDTSKKGIAQWKLLGHQLGLLATNYHRAGYNVVINGYISTDGFEKLIRIIEPTHKVLLLPHLKVVISRDAARPEDFIMGKPAVTKHHKHFSNHKLFDDWYTIDSTIHTISDTKTDIIRILNKA